MAAAAATASDSPPPDPPEPPDPPLTSLSPSPPPSSGPFSRRLSLGTPCSSINPTNACKADLLPRSIGGALTLAAMTNAGHNGGYNKGVNPTSQSDSPWSSRRSLMLGPRSILPLDLKAFQLHQQWNLFQPSSRSYRPSLDSTNRVTIGPTPDLKPLLSLVRRSSRSSPVIAKVSREPLLRSPSVSFFSIDLVLMGLDCDCLKGLAHNLACSIVVLDSICSITRITILASFIGVLIAIASIGDQTLKKVCKPRSFVSMMTQNKVRAALSQALVEDIRTISDKSESLQMKQVLLLGLGVSKLHGLLNHEPSFLSKRLEPICFVFIFAMYFFVTGL